MFSSAQNPSIVKDYSIFVHTVYIYLYCKIIDCLKFLNAGYENCSVPLKSYGSYTSLIRCHKLVIFFSLYKLPA